jgi:uncharacterized membrane protein SirB2
MIDKLLNRIGIGFALFFMVCELSYINAKSLLYLTAGSEPIDEIFSVIGSLAFSMVTVVVMRQSTQKWIKTAFPIFDALLVFCGFNLTHYSAILNGTDNEVRFWLTVFMAVFTGLITYSLGIINYVKHEQSTSKRDQQRIDELICKLHECKRNNESLQSENESYKRVQVSHLTEIENKECEIENLQCEINKQDGEIKLLKTNLAKYKTEYMKAERSRILKKKEENRTPEEVELLSTHIV